MMNQIEYKEFLERLTGRIGGLQKQRRAIEKRRKQTHAEAIPPIEMLHYWHLRGRIEEAIEIYRSLREGKPLKEESNETR